MIPVTAIHRQVECTLCKQHVRPGGQYKGVSGVESAPALGSRIQGPHTAVDQDPGSSHSSGAGSRVLTQQRSRIQDPHTAVESMLAPPSCMALRASRTKRRGPARTRSKVPHAPVCKVQGPSCTSVQGPRSIMHECATERTPSTP